MREHSGISGLVGLALLGMAGRAGATPTRRAEVAQKGDFVLIGNTLGQECGAGTPPPVVGTVGSCGSSGVGDAAPDVFWRSDTPTDGAASANDGIAASQARSTAMLNVPPGASITHAFVYWGATRDSAGVDTAITIERPGAFSESISATSSSMSANNAYQSVADVTSIVESYGSGAYRVSDVEIANLVSSANSNSFAGWWMVVFYKLPTDPPRLLTLFDGLDHVTTGNPQTAQLSGFIVPAVGFGAKLGVVAFEGDKSLLNDQLFFYSGGTPDAPLSDDQNPANNFFNSTRSLFGAALSVTGDLPQLTGTPQSMSSVDFDVVDVTPKIVAGQTSATIRAATTGDSFYVAGFVTSISNLKPDLSSSVKSAVDVNGGALLPGDVIEYTIEVTNTGNDTSKDTVLTDALPAGVTYKPGSLAVTQGPNMDAKTDISLDDQGEYDALGRTVTVRLGNGADGDAGGTLATGESTTVVFQVTVDAGVTGTIANQASVSAAGQGGWPAESAPTDGNGSESGSAPTEVRVDACVTDADCQQPTPYCDTSGPYNACIECTSDAQCPGTEPTCEPSGKSCICVPGPSELCDGIDNTCDGAIDEGNPGGGAPCSTGEPGLCDTGTTACSGGMVTCAPVVMPGSMQELCGNGVDEDCSGANDDASECGDSDGDGIPTYIEAQLGMSPDDGDSDDDGVGDGVEPSFDMDSDGDGLINALDADSDNDGLLDGTELGLDCEDAATDKDSGKCAPDADKGATTTNPLEADTDGGGVDDGIEDADKNGEVGPGETDPNDPSDDRVAGCKADVDCGGPESGEVCDVAAIACVNGCRGAGGNGCPSGQVCSSTDETIGSCGGGSGDGSGGGSGGSGSGTGTGGSTEGAVYVRGGCLACAVRPVEDQNRSAWLMLLATGAAVLRRRQRTARP